MHKNTNLIQILYYLLLITSTFSLIVTRSSKEGKIIDGRLAHVGEFPFIASVVQWNRGFVEIICGGAILNRNFVFSACQCFSKFESKGGRRTTDDISNYEVMGGTVYFVEYKTKARGEEKRLIDMIFISPKCQLTPFGDIKHDVAILKLNKPFKFNKFLKPIPVYAFDKSALMEQYNQLSHDSSTVCQAMGWGFTKVVNTTFFYYDIISVHLKVTKLLLLDNTSCFDSSCISSPSQFLTYCPEEYHDLGKICTRRVALEQGEVCYKDAGGPLVCNETVIGFTSGRGCAVDRPVFYESLYNHIDLVRNLITRSYYL